MAGSGYEKFGMTNNAIGTTNTHMPGLDTLTETRPTSPDSSGVNKLEQFEPNGRNNTIMGAKSKLAPTEVLQFPLDVNSDFNLGNHGHYIMFYINEQDRARLRMSGRGEGGSVVDDPSKAYNIASFIKKYDPLKGQYADASYQDQITKDLVNDDHKINFKDLYKTPDIDTSKQPKKIILTQVDRGKQTSGSTIRVSRRPTKRLKSSIAMYMPSSVQVTYGAQYQDTPIGAVTENALNIYNDLQAGRGSDAIKELGQIGTEVSNSLQQFLLASVGIIPGLQGTREAFEMKTGNVIADRLELAFKGINKRNFQYTFKMIPKDRREVDMIRKIIFAFKSNMLPEFVGGDRGGRRMLVPNTFDIVYMYGASQNLHLHNISTCVLENMSVSYGGDRYKTFTPDERGEGAQPVETSITLNFKEMELITRERAFEGY